MHAEIFLRDKVYLSRHDYSAKETVIVLFFLIGLEILNSFYVISSSHCKHSGVAFDEPQPIGARCEAPNTIYAAVCRQSFYKITLFTKNYVLFGQFFHYLILKLDTIVRSY